MKSRNIDLIIAMTLPAALVMPPRPAAEEPQNRNPPQLHRQRPRYAGRNLRCRPGALTAKWVVGTSDDASGSSRAFIRDGGVMMDLNALIPASSSLFLLDAYAINAQGEIVGDALEKGSGQIHAYLAIPCDAACNWLFGSSVVEFDASKSPTF